jgi:hypothetical protein
LATLVLMGSLQGNRFKQIHFRGLKNQPLD